MNDKTKINMKQFIYTLLFASCIFTVSCRQNTTPQEENMAIIEIDTNAGPDTTIQKPLPVPELNEDDKQILVAQINNSEFLSVGCCSDQNKQVEDCCCSAVIKKYKQAKASKNAQKIVKMKTEDPIFSGCSKIKKWRLLIEQIDEPEAEEKVKKEDDEFDF